MPRLIELSPEIIPSDEQMFESLDPDAVALNGTADVVITMANCVKKNTEVCVDAVVCAAVGCQR